MGRQSHAARAMDFGYDRDPSATADGTDLLQVEGPIVCLALLFLQCLYLFVNHFLHRIEPCFFGGDTVDGGFELLN